MPLCPPAVAVSFSALSTTMSEPKGIAFGMTAEPLFARHSAFRQIATHVYYRVYFKT